MNSDSDSWYDFDFDPYTIPRKRKSKDRGWMTGCIVLLLVGSLLMGILLAAIFYWLAGGNVSFTDTSGTAVAIALTQTELAITATPTPIFTPSATPTPTASPTATQATLLPDATLTPLPPIFRASEEPLPTLAPTRNNQVAQFWVSDKLLIIVQRTSVLFYDPTAPNAQPFTLSTLPNKGWRDAVVSPEQSRLAMVDTNGHIEVWDIANQVVSSFRESDTPINQIAFVDEERLAWITEAGDLYVWSVAGEPYKITKRPGVLSLAVNGDGTLVALGFANSTIEIWDIEAKQQRQTIMNSDFGFVQQVAFIPATVNLVVRDEGGAITIYNRVTAKVVRRLPTVAVSFVVGRINQLLTAEQENRLILWNYQLGEPIIRLDLDFTPATLALRPDAQAVAVVGQGGEFEIWTLNSNSPQLLISTHLSQ